METYHIQQFILIPSVVTEPPTCKMTEEVCSKDSDCCDGMVCNWPLVKRDESDPKKKFGINWRYDTSKDSHGVITGKIRVCLVDTGRPCSATKDCNEATKGGKSNGI